MLYFIGLGLFDEKDITLRGLEAVKSCDVLYLEYYTSVLGIDKKKLEDFYGKEIILAPRDLVEKEAEHTILKDAKEKTVAFLVVGDVLTATTHTDLILRARKDGIKTEIIHNTSIMTAVASTGLELYKFGKTTSMVFFDGNWKPATAYDVVEMNKANGLHTLVLLDIKVAEPTREDIMRGKDRVQEPRFMSIKDSLNQFIELEDMKGKGIVSQDTLCIGCARLGQPDQQIVFGTLASLMTIDFGEPLHSLIIPGDLHFIEEEFLEQFSVK